ARAKLGHSKGVGRVGRLGKPKRLAGMGGSLIKLTQFDEAPDQPAIDLDLTGYAGGVYDRAVGYYREIGGAQLDGSLVLASIVVRKDDADLGLDAQGPVTYALNNGQRAIAAGECFVKFTTQATVGDQQPPHKCSSTLVIQRLG